MSEAIRRDGIDTFWEDLDPGPDTAERRRRGRRYRAPAVLDLSQPEGLDRAPISAEEQHQLYARIDANIARILRAYRAPRLQRMLVLLQEILLYEKIQVRSDADQWERIRLTTDGAFWQQGEGSQLEMARGKGQHDLSQPNLAQIVYSQAGPQSALVTEEWTEEAIWEVLDARVSLGDRPDRSGGFGTIQTIGGALARGLLVFPPLGGLLGFFFIKSHPGTPLLESGLVEGAMYGGVAGLVVATLLLLLVYLR